ncbi:MAG: hypothetical protein A2751_01520 [Candidatus Doudnabacteria bacterium RIFCSPHIGHO2_01_FULL_46_14]|uniref:Type II secretion system protein J n=1 Tax=Candidatus Doudnabacteria bacterium RIFCSPHIGHO2_01_FULL_46_14 TaxID=1817824 RepID=A0A1F5NP64_9BACT|nr:MAG: hypothetical protein A2751_01520 [Candidatus Doudnabacteria bacterium RIFCSPHIGHO2_01_FULL_46_14]
MNTKEKVNKSNPKKLKSYKLQAGFTLIEAVVSAGVFALAATSIVGVYTSIQRINSRARALEAIEQNIRFINSDLTKLISNGSIDYARYTGGSVPQPSTPDLYLSDESGQQVYIHLSSLAPFDSLMIEKGAIPNTSVYNSQDVKVLNFKVYIAPATNPLVSGPGAPNEQPTVTIFIEFQANLGGRDAVRQTYQTTVATKQYPELF